MEKANIENVKEYFANGGKFIAELALDIYGESITRAGEQAFSDAIEIGIENTIMALLEVNVNDNDIIHVLNKYWGITQNEAEKRIIFEKANITIYELKRYLRMQGLSKEEIHQFMMSSSANTKIRHNSELWKLRSTPEKLVKEIQKNTKLPS